jgi:tetratricopeptide (TPR) repeat protein
MIPRLAFVALVSTASLALFSCSGKSRTTHPWFKTAPAEDNQVFEKILQSRKNKDFEEAIALARKGVNGKPPDDFLLQTVADTYFERAQEEPAKREQWVKLALQYSEQALQENPADIVNVFNVGESYLSAGMNMSRPGSCGYYEKSLERFEQLKADPALKNDSAIIEGELVSMNPYRQRLDEKIEQARQLATGCPTVNGSGG